MHNQLKAMGACRHGQERALAPPPL